jgi:putative polyhydroxyalkanoate system protein
MSEIVVQRKHALGLASARRMAEQIAGQLRAQYGGSYAWHGDTLRFQRTGASGHVAVTPDDVEVRVDVGWLLIPLRSRIEREIRAFFDEQIPPAVAPPAPRQAPRPAARASEATRSSRSHGRSRSVRPK